MDDGTNNTLITAVATVMAAVVGAIATVLLTHWINNRKSFPVNKDRLNALKGIWRGAVVQDTEREELKEYSIQLNLDVKGRTITGKGIVDGKDTQTVNVSGAFQYDSYIRINYKNYNKDIMQFGAIVLHLTPDCKLEGNFVGFGYHSRKIIKGTVNLDKIAN